MLKNCIFLLSLISISALAQKNVKESVAFEKPPKIDGDVSDWSCEWWIDPDGKFFSNVTNDADNLYVRLKIADDITQQKIGLFGLSVKLNPTGKRKGKVGLKYPVGKDASEFKKNEPEAVDRSADINNLVQMKKDLISDVEVVELIGLAKQNIVSSRLGLANGIEAIIVAQNDGAYIYEAKIPFKAFRIKKSDVENLGVEFETGRYIPQSKNNNNNAGNTPGPGGYGSGYGAGGYRQPRMYYSNYQYNALSSPGYYFVAVKLK
ncbi:MAG TPA: hypothetical protein DGG95_14345 [Cytophagales bacterium]|jgi:hypothetical protein|nr:hypothetical protein [Cytophagales bacterium]